MLLSDIVKMIHAINTINQNKAINEEKTNWIIIRPLGLIWRIKDKIKLNPII